MTRFDQTNNSKTIVIGGINCTGSEQYLAECNISGWENSTCSSNSVAISCSKFILRLWYDFPMSNIVHEYGKGHGCLVLLSAMFQL